MAVGIPVVFGIECTNVASPPGSSCTFGAVNEYTFVAGGVQKAALDFGHTQRFAYANDNAFASDYEHPEVNANGDSLNMIDNVHLMYYADHGATETGIGFTNHFNCLAFYANMRLGVKLLRWMVLDVCGAVSDSPSVGESVMRTWSRPTDGDSAHPLRALHVLCGFIGLSYAGIDTGRGKEFVTAISRGQAVGPAWLDAAFARSNGVANLPVIIAPGSSGADAAARRDNGRLADRDAGPAPATHLAWNWRA